MSEIPCQLAKRSSGTILQWYFTLFWFNFDWFDSVTRCMTRVNFIVKRPVVLFCLRTLTDWSAVQLWSVVQSCLRVLTNCHYNYGLLSCLRAPTDWLSCKHMSPRLKCVDKEHVVRIFVNIVYFMFQTMRPRCENVRSPPDSCLL